MWVEHTSANMNVIAPDRHTTSELAITNATSLSLSWLICSATPLSFAVITKTRLLHNSSAVATSLLLSDSRRAISGVPTPK